MKRVAFHTLGCKVNQYETQAMTELFEKSGYTLVEDKEVADVYIINTCTVTNIGDKKSRQFIRRAKRNNKDAIIAVVGCYAQTAPEEVMEIEGVNLIIGTNDRNKIVEMVEKCDVSQKLNLVDDIMKVKEFEEMSLEELKGKTRAFLKIQEGCNQYCSYCIIPYARGPIRSRQMEEVIKEVKRLVDNGFKEVVLTGIHVASYGIDLEQGNELIKLLKQVNDIQGLERIRLSSLEPTLFTEEFLMELSSIEKICPHFHLSLQSGCDKILKKMNRKYTTDQYRNIVKRIRQTFPMIALTTDIIVGFPSESETDFENTYEFVKEMEFSDIHVFKYSPRKGTIAASYPEQVSGIEKNQRSEKLINLADQLRYKYQSMFLEKTKRVLFESPSQEVEGAIEGLTDNYLKVLIYTKEDIEGSLRNVYLKQIKGEYLLGELI